MMIVCFDELDQEDSKIVLGDQVTPNKEDALADLDLFMKSKTQQETVYVYMEPVLTKQKYDKDKVAQENENDDRINFLQYLNFFPEKLREEYIDILIINTNEDYEGAKQLSEWIKQKVKFCRGLKPNVALLDEVFTDNSFRQLDYVYSRSFFMLMYVTNNFSNDNFKLFQSYRLLEKTFESQDKSRTVIPVYTSPKQCMKPKLPMVLDNDLGLNNYDGTLAQKVTDISEHKSDMILGKKFSLMEKRKSYFDENFNEIISRKKHFKNELLLVKLSVCNSGFKCYEGLQSTTSVENKTKSKKVDAEVWQRMSKISLTTKRKFVTELELSSSIELDGGDQVTPNKEDALADLDLFMKSKTQQETVCVCMEPVLTKQKHKAHENDMISFLQYLNFFPEKLREEYIDILIIYSNEDYEGAKQLSEWIKQKVKFCRGLKPNVALLDEVFTDHSFQQLDYVYSRSFFMLMYVTNNFSNDNFKLFQSYRLLEKTFESQDKSRAVIPVYTSPKQCMKPKLPMVLDNDLGLNNYDGTLAQKVTDIFEHKSDLILGKKFSLMEKRKSYFDENFNEIMSRKKHFKNELLLVKLSVCNFGCKCNEGLQSTTSVENKTKSKKVDAEVWQRMSKISLTTKRKFVTELELSSSIELDGDVYGQSMNYQQNVQQKYDGSHFSSVHTKKKKDTNKSNCCFPDEEIPTVNYRS